MNITIEVERGNGELEHHVDPFRNYEDAIGYLETLKENQEIQADKYMAEVENQEFKWGEAR